MKFSIKMKDNLEESQCEPTPLSGQAIHLLFKNIIQI